MDSHWTTENGLSLDQFWQQTNKPWAGFLTEINWLYNILLCLFTWRTIRRSYNALFADVFLVDGEICAPIWSTCTVQKTGKRFHVSGVMQNYLLMVLWRSIWKYTVTQIASNVRYVIMLLLKGETWKNIWLLILERRNFPARIVRLLLQGRHIFKDTRSSIIVMKSMHVHSAQQHFQEPRELKSTWCLPIWRLLSHSVKFALIMSKLWGEL